MARERWSLTAWQRTRSDRATPGLIAIAPLAICAIAFSGCWPFNRTPPQQKYFDALKVGNSAQASQIWLQMSPGQRTEFERGQGIRPSTSPKSVQQAIDEHYYSEENDDDSAPKQVELAPGTGTGAGLQDLPSYLKGNSATSAPQPAPTDQ
jgi:hypothetical protein